MRRLVLSCALSALAFASLPQIVSATSIAGPNGKIAFTSARPSDGVPAPNTGDKGARIYVADYPSGTPVQVTTLPAGAEVRHRQPNWSPDHSRIAYAAGTFSGNVYALWIKDLRTGSQTQFVPPTTGLDRPSWSPDGTEIAYGAEGDLWVKGVAPGSTATRVTDDAGTEERPVWSPDGNTLYYNRGVSPTRDIYKISPVTTSATETQVTTAGTDDWQPALSPDGKTLCYTRGPMNDTADIYLIGVNGGLSPVFSDYSAGNINCVWSPDGSRVLFTRGVFSAGELALREADGSVIQDPAAWAFADHFDGNTDWATNFSPECDPKSASIPVNGFTTIGLSCTDPDFGFGAAPPTPTPIDDSALEIVNSPKNGTLGGLDEGKVIYSPKKDFKGTDTFTYTGEDNESLAPPATVTINVGLEGPQPGGGTAGGQDKKAPVVSAIKVSNKRWRLGRKLATISLSPIGTTISFRLNEAAKASVSFQRAMPGKRVGKTCAKPTPSNVDGKPCKRYVGAGALNSLTGKAGNNKVRFQGRLTRTRALTPGAYRVRVGARDAARNRALPKVGPTFTIVNE
jgi:hypothetical protein